MLSTDCNVPLRSGGAVWTGTLRVEGGGFCGARTRRLDLDLASFDGIALRVRGDGQTFKLNLKTVTSSGLPSLGFRHRIQATVSVRIAAG